MGQTVLPLGQRICSKYWKSTTRAIMVFIKVSQVFLKGFSKSFSKTQAFDRN